MVGLQLLCVNLTLACFLATLTTSIPSMMHQALSMPFRPAEVLSRTRVWYPRQVTGLGSWSRTWARDQQRKSQRTPTLLSSQRDSQRDSQSSSRYTPLSP